MWRQFVLLRMRNRSFRAVVIIPFLLLLWRVVIAQNNSDTPALHQQPHISEVMDWIDKNGLKQAKVGVRTLGL